MTNTNITLVITVTGFVLSVVSSIAIAGFRAGRMSRDIEYIRRDLSLLMSLFKLVPINSDVKSGGS